jgi:hypothetical protein
MDSASPSPLRSGFARAAASRFGFAEAARRRLSGKPAGLFACAIALWLGVTPQPAAAAQLQGAPASYPLCTADQLAGFPWTHPAFGKQLPGIALRNMSLEICRVAGYPTLRAYESSGEPAPIRFERTPFIDQRIYAYSVVPGAAVFFALYGHPPRGEFDRSCLGITQLDVLLPNDPHAIDVTLSSGTCGGRLSYSQLFPVAELAR